MKEILIKVWSFIKKLYFKLLRMEQKMKNKDELDIVLDKLLNKIADINNFKHFSNSATKKTLEQFEKNINLRKNNKNIPNTYSSNIFYYYDIEDGISRPLPPRENTMDNVLDHILLHKNKQFQWFLVEAYELYEDYLNNLYAYLGFKDHNFWPAKDYGNISINDIPSKDFYWFKDQVEKIKGRPESLYRQIKKRIPTIEYIETNNTLETDFRFYILLISKLRHIIVHNGGYINDINKFRSLILRELGISENSSIAASYKATIDLYIGHNESKNFVLLLELQDTSTQIPLNIYHDRIKDLINKLVAYAMLFTKYSKIYLDKNPNIKKLAVNIEEYKNTLNKK